MAEDTVTPRIAVEEVIVDNQQNGVSETGYVTTLSPGILIDSSGPRSDVSIDYALDAIYYHDLDQEDREVHVLALGTEFRHRPGRWVSNVNADNRLVNGDIDGLQSSNPYLISGNNNELFTADARSTYTDRLGRNLRYLARFGINYADEEGFDANTGYDVGFTIDNQISENVLTWRGEANSRVAEDANDEVRIDELEATLDYRFDRTLSAFVELTAIETDSADLNEDSRLVGLRWRPSPQSFISVGIGKRGDDDSYELDANITRARSVFSARYSEAVESVRDQLFDPRNEQFGEATSQSAKIIPILRKRADIAWTLIGIRSDLKISLFRNVESNPEISNDQKITGADIVFDRRLSPHSSFSVTALVQDTEFTEKTTLEELRLSYQKAIAKNAGIKVFLSGASFDSTNPANDYDQKSAGASFRITF